MSRRERLKLQSSAWLTEFSAPSWSVPGRRWRRWPKPGSRRGRRPWRKQPGSTGALSVSPDLASKHALLKKMTVIASVLLRCSRSSRKRPIDPLEKNVCGNVKWPARVAGLFSLPDAPCRNKTYFVPKSKYHKASQGSKSFAFYGWFRVIRNKHFRGLLCLSSMQNWKICVHMEICRAQEILPLEIKCCE